MALSKELNGLVLLIFGFIALPMWLGFAATAMNSEYTNTFTGVSGIITLSVLVAAMGLVATGFAKIRSAFGERG